MTKNQARAWAYLMTIRSLRSRAETMTAAWVSPDAPLTDQHLEKYRSAMRELADYLEKRSARYKEKEKG